MTISLSQKPLTPNLLQHLTDRDCPCEIYNLLITGIQEKLDIGV